jgi:uncharacterized DUF497 family protein
VQDELVEWNDAKAARNFRIHGVDFREGRTVLEDPFAITIPDQLHSEDEQRSITIGRSLLDKVLLVVHTERKERIRSISARKATPLERFRYESEG